MFAAATDSLAMQLKAKEKDALLVIAFLKGMYWMMQRSNNDIKIKNWHTELHNNNEKEGNNEDKPTDLNFLINWFNLKRFRKDYTSQVLESENTLMKLLSLEFYNGFFYGTCP